MSAGRGAAGIGVLLALGVLGCPGVLRAADAGHARQVVQMVYDVSLYTGELDRAMQEATTRGIYGGAGSTVAGRTQDRALTRQTMLAQREAVLAATTAKVAARASDPQLDALLAMAAGREGDPALVQPAVGIVKASFQEALWDQLARTARGNTEFPCTKDEKSKCH